MAIYYSLHTQHGRIPDGFIANSLTHIQKTKNTSRAERRTVCLCVRPANAYRFFFRVSICTNLKT